MARVSAKNPQGRLNRLRINACALLFAETYIALIHSFGQTHTILRRDSFDHYAPQEHCVDQAKLAKYLHGLEECMHHDGALQRVDR